MLKEILKNKKFKYNKTLTMKLLYDGSYSDQFIASLVTKIDAHIENANSIYKNSKGDTTTVAMVELASMQLVIKRYNFRNFWHAIKLQFRQNYALRSFFYANLLPAFGIASIKPIAVIQRKMGWLKKQSYFVSEFEKGITGCSYFNDKSSEKSAWPETIEAILKIIYKMKQNAIHHGDFHFGNFLIVNQKPLLLDLDNAKIIRNKNTFLKLHNRDLENFARYLKQNKIAYALFCQNPENVF